ncbi:interferon beta [Otolemur garnettii]|uniref:Interferon beta n=1 Tax=Otolemur garnettii TaxID=30611 RepID=H0XKS8_OTOGA|nr:interferon beta [Otolemur garnettii]
MTNKCILQVILLLCFLTMASSTSSSLLQFQQRRSTLGCQKLLRQLNGKPEGCLKDRMNFEIPKEIKQPQHLQKEDAMLFIYEMLQNIFRILRRDFSSTGWNETIVDALLANFHQQMDSLETTLDEKLEDKNFIGGKVTNILHLKSYYFRITWYLKAKRYSSCAWTVVREEILRNLFFINRLTGYLKN